MTTSNEHPLAVGHLLAAMRFSASLLGVPLQQDGPFVSSMQPDSVLAALKFIFEGETIIQIFLRFE